MEIWKNLKHRFALKRIGIGCCGGGAIFASSTPPTITIIDALSLHDEDRREDPRPRRRIHSVPIAGRAAEDSGMNLAMALAAERILHGGDVKTLLDLIEETEGVDLKGMKRDKVRSGGGEGDGVCCCVCMERNKGAAFIPCGHTFCRTCSRELWLNRGSCPICNRSISQILDIF